MSHLLDQFLSQTSSKMSTTNSNRFKYTHRAWCQSDKADYCPLVIALMSFIILVSLGLILFLCARTSFKCKYLRKMFNRNQTSLQPTTRLNRTMSNLSTLSSINRSAFTINPIPFQPQSVWSTDNSKFARPPPTYEESQTTKSSKFTRVIRTYPRKMTHVPIVVQSNQSANVNDAFSMENITEPVRLTRTVNRNVFPSYRCLSLTTSPSTRSGIQRLNSISAHLAGENCTNEQILQADLFTQVVDEVPPSYDSVIGCNQLARVGSIRTVSTHDSFVSRELIV